MATVYQQPLTLVEDSNRRDQILGGSNDHAVTNYFERKSLPPIPDEPSSPEIGESGTAYLSREDVSPVTESCTDSAIPAPPERAMPDGIPQQESQRADIERPKVKLKSATPYRRSWLFDWWLLELAGMILSLTSIITILSILFQYNNRPLKDWPYSITLNAIISVLSTTAKSSMLLAVTECIGQSKWLAFHANSRKLIDFHMLDEASRGPLGSARLLFRFTRFATLASAGAVIILGSVLMDPFSQQILRYPLRSVIAYGRGATMPKMQSWIDNDIGHPGNPDKVLSGYAYTLGLQALLYDTLSNPDTSNSHLAFDCGTGNCTFEPFKTLAFCSTCSDVTACVGSNCQDVCLFAKSGPDTGTDPPDSIPLPCAAPVNASDARFGSLYRSRKANQSCNYTLLPPQNLPPKTPFLKDPSATSPAKILELSLSSLSDILLKMETAVTLWGANRVSFVNMTTKATSIANNPYVKTSYVNTGSPLLVLGRAVMNHDSQLSPASGIIDFTPTIHSCALSICVQTINATVQNGVLHEEKISTWQNDSTTQSPQEFYVVVPPDEGHPADSADLTFVMESSSASILLLQIEQNLESNATSGNLSGLEFSSAFGAALWKSQDLNSIMAPLADRLTDWLRLQPGNTVVQGEAHKLEVHISVNWWWATPPIALVLSSYLLLGLFIYTSSKHDMNAWKSNSLATLFHGIVKSPAETMPLMFSEQMEKAAKKMDVSLVDDGGGFISLMRQSAMKDGT